MGFDGDRLPRSLYNVLGIQRRASQADIRKAYKKLAMKWHPDRWSKNKRMEEEAKRRFQDILKAYQVLSNREKRVLYDMGFYEEEEDDEEEVEGFGEFMEEMLVLMSDVRREGKAYSLIDLWGILQNMGEAFP